MTQAILQQEQLIQKAIACLEKQLKVKDTICSSPYTVRQYLYLQLGAELNEIFAVLFLDNRLRLVAFEKLFQGSISVATVYPRVIVQRALAHNAASVILVHNHPSGSSEPSEADKTLTQQLKSILEVIDVKVIDHFIIGASESFSFSEAGLL